MEAIDIAGCWQITSCTHASKKAKSDSYLPGGIFYLHKDDTVTWSLTDYKENPKKLSLVDCKIYKVYNATSKTYIRFINLKESIIEFQVIRSDIGNLMTLSLENYGNLYCEKYINSTAPEIAYNFLSAVDEEFFSDMTIESQNKKVFHVHSVILNMLGDDMPWFSNPPPFNGLPEDVLNVIIHWMYCEFLPETVTVPAALKVIDAVKDFQCLSKLAENCQSYIDKISIRNQFLNVINDLHVCLQQMYTYFKGSEMDIRKDPSRICLVMKHCVKEICVAAVKVMKLFDIFINNIKSSETNVKSVNEKQEIMQYVYLCLPKLFSNMRALFESLKSTLSPMTQSQKTDVVNYLVPELHSGLNMICDVLYDFRMLFERNKDFPLFFEYNHKLTHVLVFFLDKKNCYTEMSDNYKYRFVLRNLDFFIDELPIMVLKLENLVDQRQIQWKEFKSFFEMMSKSMAHTLSKLTEHRNIFQKVLEKICFLVERQSFTMDLFNLNLLEFVHDLTGTSEATDQHEVQPERPEFHDSPADTNTFGHTVNLIYGLVISPDFEHRKLSSNAFALLKSTKDADMVFEIPIQTPRSQSVKVPELSSGNNSPVDATKASNSSSTLPLCSKSEEYTKSNMYETVDDNGSVLIKAHRTIVAARCNWFRRALQSGMKEAINSHIIIHDTTPELFKELLYYLYTGNLDTNLHVEKVTELMLCGDRFELDGLKLECELLLISKYLATSNVFLYLNLADRYNAKYLKKACMEYVGKQYRLGNIEHKDVAECVSPTLQVEIDEIITYHSVNNHYAHKSDNHQAADYFSALSINDEDNEPYYSEPIGPQICDCIDYTRLNECLRYLTDIVDPRMTIQELTTIILTHDYDINSALDYYFLMVNNDI